MSTELKHTPGPWVSDSDYDIIVANEGTVIANVLGPDDFPCLRPEDQESCEAQCMANARLIAAAPDLLAALEDARRNLLWHCDPRHDGTLSKIESAISKAEGRAS